MSAWIRRRGSARAEGRPALAIPRSEPVDDHQGKGPAGFLERADLDEFAVIGGPVGTGLVQRVPDPSPDCHVLKAMRLVFREQVDDPTSTRILRRDVALHVMSQRGFDPAADAQGLPCRLLLAFKPDDRAQDRLLLSQGSATTISLSDQPSRNSGSRLSSAWVA